MYNPHSSGGIIVSKTNNKIYIALTDQTEASDYPNEYWSFPKGHIEEGESSLDTAYREIYEETGFEKKDLKLIDTLGEYSRDSVNSNGDTFVKKMTLFLFKSNKNHLQTKSESRIGAFR
jgi:8-oxo-dGTP pyrophosphatase MutT (NUDIX family)